MHPAPSIIVFTTLSGLGFGLIAMLGLGAVPGGTTMAFFASALGAGLALVGLASSTLHLGHPERAWRALSQWRSSWLSREGVMAVITLTLFGLYALLWLIGGQIRFLGLLVAVSAAITVYTTAMIYGSLQSVPRWHTRLTPLVYLGFAVAGGSILALFLASLSGQAPLSLSLGSILFLLIAWIFKGLWWQRADRTGLNADGSTVATAIGLPAKTKVRLLEAPHTSPNYLMKEMVFRIGRKHAERLRLIAIGAGAILPVLVLIVGLFAGGWFWPLLAGLLFLSGTLAERWLFFAEAEHVVSLYY